MATRSSSPRRRVAAKSPARAAIATAPAAVTTKALPEAPGGIAQADATKPKHKLVRDSFTIPKSEYMVLTELKLRAAQLSRPVKKSELLRAGIGALNAMQDKAFLTALGSVPSLKTGRPKHAQTTADKTVAKKA